MVHAVIDKEMHMAERTTLDTFHQMLADLERDDWAALAQHPGLGETREHFPHVHAAFPDLRHTIESEFVNGEMLAAVVYLEGTHLGPYWGLAPTGKKVRYRILFIDQIVDGKVVLHHAAPDFLGLFAQLGAPLRPEGVNSEA